MAPVVLLLLSPTPSALAVVVLTSVVLAPLVVAVYLYREAGRRADAV